MLLFADSENEGKLGSHFLNNSFFSLWAEGQVKSEATDVKVKVEF